MLSRVSIIIYPLVLLTLLALLTYWVNISVQPNTQKNDGDRRHDPDYMMHEFLSTQTDVAGALRYRLKALEMKHYPDDDSTDLIQPVYTQYRNNQPYVWVEGMHGEVSSNGLDIKIYKNVKVMRAANATQEAMTLETDYLNILPEEDLVLTQKPVVIKQAPNTVVYANGMVYEKKKLTMTLLNKVRAHYEKPIKNNNKINSLENQLSKQTQVEVETNKKKVALPKNLPNPKKLKQSAAEIADQTKSAKIIANEADNMPSDHQPSNTNKQNNRIRRQYESIHN